jgi:PIN domain nuclease of toxin-antitoxin system
MTGVLLDTHVALWLVADPERLGEQTTALLSAQPSWVSAVSLWELAIKQQLGKLSVKTDVASALRDSGVGELALNWRHTAGYADVELAHRDPFDRLLVAQAHGEGLSFSTADRAILAANLPFVIDARR